MDVSDRQAHKPTNRQTASPKEQTATAAASLGADCVQY